MYLGHIQFYFILCLVSFNLLRYHSWMTNKELQELTASEPLTLPEEYEMQASWRNDDDSNVLKIKHLLFDDNVRLHIFFLFLECTFLILDKEKFIKTNDEIDSLIGDTNLFLLTGDVDDTTRIIAETEIMIAELQAHGKRFGWESMLLMLEYGQRYIHCNKFIAKIGFNNVKSINMFTKMKFVELSRSEVFQEITFERCCTSDWLEWLQKNIEYKIEKYNS